MTPMEIRWNDEARSKIVNDADRVLREAVIDVSRTEDALDSDTAFERLNGRLKDKFIDYEPGPDVRKYADAIANGDIHE